MLVLSHEMIPHHHHDLSVAEVSGLHNHNGEYSQQKKTQHHHHHDGTHQHNPSKNTENRHNHAFPFHQHLSPTSDFDYLRINVIRDVIFNFQLLTILNTFFESSLSEPPELDFIRFTDKPFYITARFEPGAIGLRAPPSIA